MSLCFFCNIMFIYPVINIHHNYLNVKLLLLYFLSLIKHLVYKNTALFLGGFMRRDHTWKRLLLISGPYVFILRWAPTKNCSKNGLYVCMSPVWIKRALRANCPFILLCFLCNMSTEYVAPKTFFDWASWYQHVSILYIMVPS